jgi:hypothetical protein
MLLELSAMFVLQSSDLETNLDSSTDLKAATGWLSPGCPQSEEGGKGIFVSREWSIIVRVKCLILVSRNV